MIIKRLSESLYQTYLATEGSLGDRKDYMDLIKDLQLMSGSVTFRDPSGSLFDTS